MVEVQRSFRDRRASPRSARSRRRLHQARLLFHLASPVLLGPLACGPEPEEPLRTIQTSDFRVSASPRGQTFEGSISVALESDRPAQVYYTLGGASPTGEGAQLYEGPILLEEQSLLTFVGVTDDGVWSTPQVELYTKKEEARSATPQRRALSISTDILYFEARHGDDIQRRSLRIRSVGLERVRLSRVGIGVSQGGWAFYEPDVFTLEDPIADDHDLWPGQELELAVRYQPSETIRGAALYLQTDDTRVTDGLHVIQLWGRIFNW